MLRSPKKKFSESIHKDKFKQIVMSEAFEEATLAAMLQLLNEQNKHGSAQDSLDLHQQMVGARKYLETLVTIWEPVKDNEPVKPTGLNYSAGV